MHRRTPSSAATNLAKKRNRKVQYTHNFRVVIAETSGGVDEFKALMSSSEAKVMERNNDFVLKLKICVGDGMSTMNARGDNLF